MCHADEDGFVRDDDGQVIGRWTRARVGEVAENSRLLRNGLTTHDSTPRVGSLAQLQETVARMFAAMVEAGVITDSTT